MHGYKFAGTLIFPYPFRDPNQSTYFSIQTNIGKIQANFGPYFVENSNYFGSKFRVLMQGVIE